MRVEARTCHGKSTYKSSNPPNRLAGLLLQLLDPALTAREAKLCDRGGLRRRYEDGIWNLLRKMAGTPGPSNSVISRK